MKIIDGKKLSIEIEQKIVKKIQTIKGRRPSLAIILVGSREDSKLYIKLKEEAARRTGIDTHFYKCDENAPKEEILQIIDHLNKDEDIDTILVQLPLPKHLDPDKIITAIDPKKDVDRFHPENLRILQGTCSHNHVLPPVFAAVLGLIKNTGKEIENQEICILANSKIFGDNLKRVLECKQGKVNIISEADKKIKEKTKKADILISAVGKPGLVRGEMINNDTIIIDVGITKEKEKIKGDVDFDSFKKKKGWITPVPGGVGPMTVAMLLDNVMKIFESKQ